MNDTPRTDEAQVGTGRVSVSFARQLERELNAANERIKRMEEAGDNMAEWLEDMRNLGADACLSYAWREAKEDKL